MNDTDERKSEEIKEFVPGGNSADAVHTKDKSAVAWLSRKQTRFVDLFAADVGFVRDAGDVIWRRTERGNMKMYDEKQNEWREADLDRLLFMMFEKATVAEDPVRDADSAFLY